MDEYSTMQIAAKFHIVGSNKCPKTQIAKQLLTKDGELAFTYIDIDQARWLATIIERSEFHELPIIFDFNFNLIGGIQDLQKYLQDDSLTPETTRISELIKKAIDRRST